MTLSAACTRPLAVQTDVHPRDLRSALRPCLQAHFAREEHAEAQEHLQQARLLANRTASVRHRRASSSSRRSCRGGGDRRRWLWPQLRDRPVGELSVSRRPRLVERRPHQSDQPEPSSRQTRAASETWAPGWNQPSTTRTGKAGLRWSTRRSGRFVRVPAVVDPPWQSPPGTIQPEQVADAELRASPGMTK